MFILATQHCSIFCAINLQCRNAAARNGSINLGAIVIVLPIHGIRLTMTVVMTLIGEAG